MVVPWAKCTSAECSGEALVDGAEEAQPLSITSIKTEVGLNSTPNAICRFRRGMSVADLSLEAVGGSGGRAWSAGRSRRGRCLRRVLANHDLSAG